MPVESECDSMMITPCLCHCQLLRCSEPLQWEIPQEIDRMKANRGTTLLQLCRKDGRGIHTATTVNSSELNMWLSHTSAVSLVKYPNAAVNASRLVSRILTQEFTNVKCEKRVNIRAQRHSPSPRQRCEQCIQPESLSSVEWFWCHHTSRCHQASIYSISPVSKQ